jgi:hypothetical protein
VCLDSKVRSGFMVLVFNAHRDGVSMVDE